MKKKSIIVVSIVFIITIVLSGVLLWQNNNKQPISKILSSQSYDYLPKQAKKYIEKIYEETGEVVLTEKNKEDNKPYLNPDYIDYLELSEEEKESIDLIPDTYILDYSMNQSYKNRSLPSKYDLRNLNGHNFVSPIKNQGTTSICWAFASVENIETLYMKNNNQSYSDLIPKFSVRQMDYITSTKYDSSSSHSYLAIKGNWSSGMCTYSSGCSWTPWDNPDNGSHELDEGGNFFTSSIAMANGITLTDETTLPWHEEKKPVLVNDIYGYDKSLYEVNSTIQMSTINEDHASDEEINSYVSDVKNYMMEYGGPFVGTYSPQSTCGFENVDGSKMLKTDDCINDTNTQDLGHAMQIIGWDDDYEYSYCESGTTHNSVNSNGTCSSGTLTTGKGVWIVRNSWGTETTELQKYSYVYLTYDSTRLSVGFATSISDMQNRTWDNNYHANPWIDRSIASGMVTTNTQTKEYNTHNNESEKVEKIKFLAFSKNGIYNVSVLTENNNYNNIGTVTTTEAGIYTIDLSDKNIILEDKEFSVKVESTNGAVFVYDSIAVFTSNVSKDPSLDTNYIQGFTRYEEPDGKPSENNVVIMKSTKTMTAKLEHYVKNVSDYKKIKYKVFLDGVEYNNYFFDNYSSISSNMIYLDGLVSTTLDISKEDYSDVDVCGKTYTFQILYDDIVIESFPVKRICNNWDNNSMDYTKSIIRFHKNDGSGYYSSTSNNDTTNLKIMKSDGTSNAYIGDKKKFFQYDKYIKSWNTKADGTGTTYIDNNFLVYKDTDLYAQWSNPETEPHYYKIEWQCNRYICHATQILTRTTQVTFNKEFTVPTNTFTNLTEGQEFIYWAFDPSDLSKGIFYEEEKVKNITESGFDSPYNNEEYESLEAVWSDSYHSVTFDANNGTGTMKGIKIIDGQAARLKYNFFVREDYEFVGWNTKADGTGTGYSDGQSISLTEDITLYAQWEAENTYTITFYANNGTNDSTTQNIPEAISKKLNKNTFTYTGYAFTGWNTESDGTGTPYEDEQSVSLSSNLTLYAQWEMVYQYTITFNANNGTNDTTTQNMPDSIATKLNKNTFKRTGYTFTNWNTKANGTGTSYADEQNVSISNNLTLYAQWTINKYTITFNTNGGSTIESQIVEYGSTVNRPVDPSKEGYTFDGWYTNSSLTTPFDFNTEIKSNKTLYAKWTQELKKIPVYRMYNPVNGEHLFTANPQEVEVLYKYQGWGKEGIGWYYTETGTPVYRLYSPKFNNHLYTSNMAEITLITTRYGWVYDFDARPVMYSNGDVAIYRLYNPSLSDQHHLTTSFHEYTIATQWGWRQEGIAMYAAQMGVPENTHYYK